MTMLGLLRPHIKLRQNNAQVSSVLVLTSNSSRATPRWVYCMYSRKTPAEHRSGGFTARTHIKLQQSVDLALKSWHALQELLCAHRPHHPVSTVTQQRQQPHHCGTVSQSGNCVHCGPGQCNHWATARQSPSMAKWPGWHHHKGKLNNSAYLIVAMLASLRDVVAYLSPSC